MATTSKGAGKKTPPPRPNKNSDGQAAQPSPQDLLGQDPNQGPPQGPPSMVPPGAAPPMAAIAAQHAAATQMPPGPQGPGMPGPQGPPQGMPPGAPAPPPGAQQGIMPSQWPHNQVREGVNFKDLPPLGQAQVEEQEGVNPAAPLQMIQGQLQSSMQEPGGPQGGPQQGPVPASFIGPMVPPGVENFPHDMAALTQVMQRGYAPGADNAEHAMAQNAHSMARAAEQHAQNQAAQSGQSDRIMQALGGLMQHLSMAGALPAPEDVARHVARGAVPGMKSPTGQPQLSSSY